MLIAHLDQHDAHHATARERLLEVGHEPLGASSITLAEVLVAPARAGRLTAGRTALRTLAVAELPLPSDAAERLAELRSTTRLRLPDCCVLLCAEVAGGAVVTLDDRLAREATRLGLGR